MMSSRATWMTRTTMVQHSRLGARGEGRVLRCEFWRTTPGFRRVCDTVLTLVPDATCFDAHRHPTTTSDQYGLLRLLGPREHRPEPFREPGRRPAKNGATRHSH